MDRFGVSVKGVLEVDGKYLLRKMKGASMNY